MRSIISILEIQFELTDERTRLLIDSVSDAVLYQIFPDRPGSMFPRSCAAYILRSAAMVEQSFGGITTRLWDDPFEWTLTEKLNDRAAVLEYLDEVKAVRTKGFRFIGSDADLLKAIPAPERLKPLAQIIITSLTAAERYLGRAYALAELQTETRLSGNR